MKAFFSVCSVTLTSFIVIYLLVYDWSGPIYRQPGSDIRETFDFISSSSVIQYEVEKKTPEEKENVELTPCPTGPIVSVVDGGRLANKIWEYAAVWSVARLLGRPGYVPKSILTEMNKIYANLSLHALEEIGHCNLQLGVPINKWKLLPLDKAAENFKGNHILLEKWILLPDPVMLYKDKLHEEFRVRPDLQREVDDTVARLGGKDRIRIGVHVRRTDFVNYLSSSKNMTAVDSFFYKAAMQWYRKNVKGPLIFFIVTDDVRWCKAHLLGKKDVKIASKSAEHDLALLASCSYTIIDYGTFGYWGAMMAGGNTMSLTTDKRFSNVMSKNFKSWRTYDIKRFTRKKPKRVIKKPGKQNLPKSSQISSSG